MSFASEIRNMTNTALEQEVLKSRATDEYEFVKTLLTTEAKAGRHKLELSIANEVASYIYNLLKNDGFDVNAIPSWMPNDKQTRYVVIW